jgi:hypothetical protein
MTLLSQLAALAAIVGTGVVYGTDVFSALVQRPALAKVDDATLTAVMGNVHRFADRRMPAPGILGAVAAAAAAGLAAAAGRTAASAAAASAFLLLAGWVASPAQVPAADAVPRRRGSRWLIRVLCREAEFEACQVAGPPAV